jgi:uncharacterized RDD family membrane protein YckC
MLASTPTFCTSCGTPVAPAARFCGHCGATMPVQVSSVPLAGARYAGFWRRFAARCLDGIIVWGALFLIAMTGFTGGGPFGFGAAAILGLILLAPAYWLYNTVLESSQSQATFGKQALGLKVTDLEGRRISFARANGRYFAKIITGMTFTIGYLMVVFTEKKQALHDMIAGCVIVHTDPRP